MQQTEELITVAEFRARVEARCLEIAQAKGMNRAQRRKMTREVRNNAERHIKRSLASDQ